MTTVGIATGAGRGIGLACGQRLADMVDVLLLVDQDQASVIAAAAGLAASGRRAAIEPFVLDITDSEGLGRLAARVDELGTLSAVAHAAGISPAMADWRRIFTVNLTGTAMLAEVLRPLTVAGTATVYLSSMSPTLGINEPNEAADAALDDPLHEHFLDRIHDAIGSAVQDPGLAYVWAKQGVRRFAQQEAVRIGPHRARVCSLSPGIIDTPHSQLEADSNPFMDAITQQTPLGRVGDADEIATVVAFLLSDEASFITGTDLLVDGGVCAALTGPAAST